MRNFNSVFLKEVRRRIESKKDFQNNILCCLYYGSYFNKNKTDEYSDLDFHFVFRKYENNIIEDLSDIFEKGCANLDISIHILDEIELNNYIIFQNGTQKTYFIKILQYANTLLGENVYKSLGKKVKQNEVRESLIFKIKEYIWRLRLLSVSQNFNDRSTARLFIKTLKKTILDILLLEKVISFKEGVFSDRATVLKTYLSEESREIYDNEKIALHNILINEIIDPQDISAISYLLYRELRKINGGLVK